MERKEEMGIVLLMIVMGSSILSNAIKVEEESRRVIELKGGPEEVTWVVQLSDLHFSVHHPQRAIDFKDLVGPTLSFINPPLVLLTGDLTDGKSEDLLTMKQDEAEWIEYQKVMEDVITRSGLDKSSFYDLRGNHDSFAVPVIGGSFDFFSRYSINGQLGRTRKVNSVTIQSSDRKHLFVGFDSTMSIGLRGPTNLFGHPTDQLLDNIDSELSQWDSQPPKPVTKISFGHFPLSFSAASDSQNTLEDTFLKHSVSAYLCGHLHTRFGKNLKRQHQSGYKGFAFSQLFQPNIHRTPSKSYENCSNLRRPKEFWEWEMGDWRKSRAMRILAIDRGHVSFIDIDFKLEAKRTIILPTFPLDSRFMSTTSSHQKFKCHSIDLLSYETMRALVFSASPITSVIARIYDTRPGYYNLVVETFMTKNQGNNSRGDLYASPWNFKAFEDSSPDRFWLQIEAIDYMGRSSLTELQPFSINGLTTRVSWTWKELMVMGCQWDALYYPILWSSLTVIYSILLLPKALLLFSKNRVVNTSGITWALTELDRISWVWFGMLCYSFHLVLFPWLLGQVFSSSSERAYMTYKGWVVNIFKDRNEHEYVGFPDIMVVVLPHIFFVVLPAVLVIGALAVERGLYRTHFLLLSGKKQDDYTSDKRSKFCIGKRWIRKILLVVCLAIFWKHFKNCRALTRAYEMNPLFHFPLISLSVPLLLASAVYKTRK